MAKRNEVTSKRGDYRRTGNPIATAARVPMLSDAPEEWRPVVGYEGLYEVSNKGRIKTLKRRNPKIRKTYLNPSNGNVTIALSDSLNRMRTFTIHRLMAIAFLGTPPQGKPEINHKDGLRVNNIIENVEWCSRKENVRHQFEVLGQRGPWFGKCGSQHFYSRAVEQIGGAGNIIARYGSFREAERATGVEAQSIGLVCNGKRKRAGGYYWRSPDKPKRKGK